VRCGWAAILGIALTLACGATTRRGEPQEVATPGGGGAAGDGSGGVASVGVVGGGGAGACTPPRPTLVRLAFSELVASARSLLSDELGDAMASALDLDQTRQSFPPQLSEGYVINDSIFSMGDALAQLAGKYVREHFDTTGCSVDDYPCVSDYVAQLGERAFRRPLSDEERDALLLTVERASALGEPADVGAEYGVYAVFESPHFLYRTSFGEAAPELGEGELRLTSYELASNLAFFLTGEAPDDALLDSASRGSLDADPELGEHVDRLLAGPKARAHLERSLAQYVGVGQLDEVVIDPAIYPTFSPALRSAMRRELDELIAGTLWSGPAAALLTTRTAVLNADLAQLYGVTWPPPSLDSAGFGEAQLPSERAGLLTRAGFLTARSRPDGASIVGRGLQVLSLLCHEAPPFPDLQPADPPPPDSTRREQAEYRMTTEGCSECHVDIDPFGLALDELDGIGQFRQADEQGRPIDASATLPELAGGASVRGGAELSRALPAERFNACLSRGYLRYALADAGGGSGETCEHEAERAATADDSFSDLIRQVALSRSFRVRRL
jgi:Protein of unknown function (DUF1592)/Protein of unknown function (DUF1588)/Protein of unknown function (DUF1595)